MCGVQVREMYNWMDVAERTQAIYDRVSLAPIPCLAERLLRYSSVGTLAGWLCCFSVAVMHLMWRVIEWLWPAGDVEIARDFPHVRWEGRHRHYEIDLETTGASKNDTGGAAQK